MFGLSSAVILILNAVGVSSGATAYLPLMESAHPKGYRPGPNLAARKLTHIDNGKPMSRRRERRLRGLNKQKGTI